MISVSLDHRFGDFALHVAFDTPAGVTALFGRSGVGKTTVVNAVAGLLHPDRGRVVVGGAVLLDTDAGIALPPHRRRVGYVFQDARLFPHMTVRRNLIYGASSAHPAGFDRAVDLLGIGHLLNRRPGGLSGGEKGRVALGRALLSHPRLLLLDEPLAALDEDRKAELLPWIERLRDEADVPILYVTHSVAEIARLATTVVILDGGRVARFGPVAEVLSDPGAVSGLGLRSAGSVLTAVVGQHEADGLSRLETPAGPLWLPQITAPEGKRLRVRIAAQDVILSRTRPEGLSALNILPGTVRQVRTDEGAGAMVQLELDGGQMLLARITGRSAQALQLAPGSSCHAVIKTVAVTQDNVGG